MDSSRRRCDALCLLSCLPTAHNAQRHRARLRRPDDTALHAWLRLHHGRPKFGRVNAGSGECTAHHSGACTSGGGFLLSVGVISSSTAPRARLRAFSGRHPPLELEADDEGACRERVRRDLVRCLRGAGACASLSLAVEVRGAPRFCTFVELKRTGTCVYVFVGTNSKPRVPQCTTVKVSIALGELSIEMCCNIYISRQSPSFSVTQLQQSERNPGRGCFWVWRL